MVTAAMRVYVCVLGGEDQQLYVTSDQGCHGDSSRLEEGVKPSCHMEPLVMVAIVMEQSPG